MKSGMILLLPVVLSVRLIVVSGSLLDHDHGPAAPDRDATSVLSDAFAHLRVRGAIFLTGLYSEKWAYRSVPVEDLAAMLIPGEDRVILFHVIASGRCWIAIEGGEKHWASAGDVIVLPYGDEFLVGGVEPAEPAPVMNVVPPPPWTQMPILRHGAGGSRTDIVCG